MTNNNQLTIISYGAGTNSTAMLIGMVERGEPVDLILFADTGAERPETYAHLECFSKWLVDHSYPAIITVRKVSKDGEVMTLEQHSLDNHMLPSIAYGFKKCSHKFKIEPQDKYVNNWQPAKDVWAQGGKVIKCIGYDMDEPHRARIPEDKKYTYRYPLLEWDWGREECIAAIQSAMIPLPGKSSYFFCPSMKKHEILALKRNYPELAARAIAMEENAELTSIAGLGRDFSWKRLLEFNEAQIQLFPESLISIDCGCYDGTND